MSKKELAIGLSKLKVFDLPKLRQEQYPTDSEIAADLTWFAEMQGDINGKTIADLGAGTGILGIACLALGASTVYFIEKDAEAFELLKENLNGLEYTNYELINRDIAVFDKEVDTIIMNPPFGTQEKHNDIIFLDKAFSLSKVVYSFHKTETKEFIKNYAREKGYLTTHYFEFKFPIKQTMENHKRKIHRINVSAFRFQQN